MNPVTAPLPPPDEPDIYESLINALIAASTAFREASPHFEAALPHMRRALELDREVQVMLEESAAVSERATELLLEAVALVQADPLGNITEALTLSAQATAVSRQARDISAQSTASTALATVEMTQGLEIWHRGSESLRVGLERATTLLQAARRRQANGDASDALTA